MDRFPLKFLIDIGMSVQWVTGLEEGAPVQGDDGVLYHVDVIVSFLEALKLPMSFGASSDLSNLRAKISGDDNIARRDAASLRTAVNKLNYVLHEEALRRYAYVLAAKRHDAEKLFADIDSVLPAGMLDSLPEICRYDLSQAGKCIAVNCPTAAGFHLTRATEGAIRHLYFSVIGREPDERTGWKALLDAIRSRVSRQQLDSPSTNLLNFLDSIRESFRNPTQHPQKTYSMDEAENLLGVCIEALGQMITCSAWQGPVPT